MQDEFEMIADDGQIAKMNEEYRKVKATQNASISHSFIYPLPVYMRDICLGFCKSALTFAKIISAMDTAFVSRNKKTMDFILNAMAKNRICIANTASITQEIFVATERMPIKQSMYRLLELHNQMSMLLSDICVYDKSAQMQEVVMRHMLAGSVLHGICI